MIADLRDRFAEIAREIRNTECTYRCAATGEPPGSCEPGTNAVTWVGLTRRIDLCAGFWSRGPDGRAETLLHEWAHYVFVRRGLGDDAGSTFDNAECYAAFAYEVTGGPVVYYDSLCAPRTTALPPRDAARIAGPCPSNEFGALSVTGGVLYGLPGGGTYGTVGVGLEGRYPLTTMHDWELSAGPRFTAAIPPSGSTQSPAYLLGLRTGLQFRYRPWRFGFQVGGYAEGGAAFLPPPAGTTGSATVNPYAVGGINAGLNFPLGRQTAMQLFLDVGGGAGLNTRDTTAFGLFQAGLGAALQF